MSGAFHSAKLGLPALSARLPRAFVFFTVEWIVVASWIDGSAGGRRPSRREAILDDSALGGAHSMAHDDSSHTCGHDHHGHFAGDDTGKLWLALLLTSAFVLAEAIAAWFAHSLALFSDACHNFADAAALGFSWYALWIAQKPSHTGMTYGYHRVGILAALVNAVSLVVIALAIFWEAVHRWSHQEPITDDQRTSRNRCNEAGIPGRLSPASLPDSG